MKSGLQHPDSSSSAPFPPHSRYPTGASTLLSESPGQIPASAFREIRVQEQWSDYGSILKAEEFTEELDIGCERKKRVGAKPKFRV